MMMEAQGPLERLARQDWWRRKKGIEDLAATHEREFLSCLENGIRNHDDANIRNTAMEVYRVLGPKALPSLSALMTDRDPEVRLFAVNVLCDIADRRAVPLLVAGIRDRDVNVRVASAEAMGRTADRRVLSYLRAAIADEPWVAMAAINSLGDIGGEEALDILYDCLRMEGYREIAVAAIEKAGDKRSIRHLSFCFEENGPADLALKAIINIAEREQVRPPTEYFICLVPSLLEMIESGDPGKREPAFAALCWSKDIRALPIFIEAIEDEKLQEGAIEGLLGIGRRAVCAIVDAMRGSVGGHRQVFAKILSLIGENMALLQFADDEDAEVRAEVALALGSLDLKTALPALSKLHEDLDDEVRSAAARSLFLLSGE